MVDSLGKLGLETGEDCFFVHFYYVMFFHSFSIQGFCTEVSSLLLLCSLSYHFNKTFCYR